MGAHRVKNNLCFGYLLLGAVLLSGCYTQLAIDRGLREPQPEPAEIEDLSLTTEEPWYERPQEEESVTVWVALENSGDEAVILAGCPEAPSFIVEKWDDDSWREEMARGFDCPAILSEHLMELDPGEWLEIRLFLRDPGWYRVYLPVGPNRDFPDAILYSNQFLIK